MKKLLLLIGIVFLFSCEKDDLHCYRCETVVNGEIVSIITTCGISESDILNHELSLEIQASAMTGSLAETKCLMKH